MVYLILSITCSTIISFIFKLFDRYKVDTFQAIVVNYFVCMLCGWVMLGTFPIKSNILEQPYFFHGFALGLLFISGFNAIATTVQKYGITIGAVLSKMSIIFSAAFAIWMYNEVLNIWKVLGVLSAVLAIWFINIPNKTQKLERVDRHPLLWLVPVYTLLSASIIEILLQYAELRLVETSGDPFFVAFLFGTAGIVGLIILLASLVTGRMRWQNKNLVGGLFLGIANYGSIYFLMRALGLGWEGSTVFPINNVAIISCTAFIAYLLFNERLSKINLIGLGLALLSILLITLSGNIAT